MLKVANIEDPLQNIIAPSVYIDSVILEKNYATIHYSLIDNNNSWMTNNEILDKFFVYVTDGLSTEKRLLKTTITANKISNNTVKDYVKFYYIDGYSTTGSHISVSAWTGNQNISGAIVQENIVISGSVQKSSYTNDNTNFLNKIKDMSLLDFNINFPTGTVDSTDNSPVMSDLFVSYRPDKKANFAFIFDLKKFLEKNSRNYNILQKKDIYKQICLTNSYIDTDKSYFKKYNLTKRDSEGIKILNKLEAFLIDPQSKKYLICIADDNIDINNKSYYDLDVHLETVDYSTKVINNNIKENLKKHIEFLNTFISFFIQSTNNKNIKNANYFVFENYFEQYINNGEISEFVNDLAPVCSLLSGGDEQKFVDLFVSILHPLNTDANLLTTLLTFLNKLEYAISTILTTSLDANNLTVATNKTNQNVYKKRFSVSTDNPYAADFNYDYEPYTGAEVVSSDSLALINSSVNEPIKTITDIELTNRKYLECKKYLDNPSISTRDNVAHLSIANIFINNKEYQLLLSSPNDTQRFNDIFTKIKETNQGLDYKMPETYVLQLLQDGVNVKTLTNRSNGSTNNLIKNTLFDNNRDSNKNSIKYVTDTNVKGLFFSLDNSIFEPYENISGSMQYYASTDQANPEAPKLKFNKEDLLSEDLKSRTFVYYNTIYKLNQVASGELVDVYSITSAATSPIFTEKLRLLTTAFMVRKKFITPIAPSLNAYKVEKDLKNNIPPIYFNRNIKSASINISISDI